MEALPVEAIPTGPGWQYEPKWDGFRCLAFRDGSDGNVLRLLFGRVGRVGKGRAAAVPTRKELF
jgi:hypothetical protein